LAGKQFLLNYMTTITLVVSLGVVEIQREDGTAPQPSDRVAGVTRKRINDARYERGIGTLLERGDLPMDFQSERWSSCFSY
jgi:hypothetical protein